MPAGKKRLTEEELKTAELADNFSEGDISDDSEGRRRRRRKRGAKDAEQRKKVLTEEFVPTSLKKLRACVFCKLVLNQEKWNKLEACPNCQDSRGLQDTTDNFENVISLILPRRSWVAEWQKMQDLIPGLYAMAIANQSQYGAGRDDDDQEDEDDELEVE